MAYESPDCPHHVRKVVDFLEFGRTLDSYKHVLHIAAWAKPDPEVPNFSIPVEDPKTLEGKRRLIPGAPQAFALAKDVYIPDTSKIAEHADPDLHPNVLAKMKDYFANKSFRSFLSLVLQVQGQPVGVLNIQCSETNLFGQDGSDMETVLKGIRHYRDCLEYILGGQRELVKTAAE